MATTSGARWPARLAFLALSLGWASARALTFEVNDPSDAPDSRPGDGVCAAQSGGCTLRAAVIESNLLAGDDIVELPGGVFQLSIPPTEVDSLGEDGDLDVLESLTVRSAPGTRTTIDGGGLDGVFDIDLGGSGQAQFSNLDIVGGASVFGGGINAIRMKSLVIDSCRIQDNQAVRGGGIHIQLVAEATLHDTIISSNVLVDGPFSSRGSAIHVQDSTLHMSRAAVFDNDTAADTRFGNVLNASGSTLSIASSTFSGNTISGRPSGESVGVRAHNTFVTLRNVTVVDNDIGLVASVFSNDLAALLVRNSIIADNGTDCRILDIPADVDGFNLDGDGSCGLATGFGNLPMTDPSLGPLAAGALTPAHFPLPQSPVIDAGSDATSGADACARLDQQGGMRLDGDGLAGSTCDLGAVEFVPDSLFRDGFE